MGQLPSLFPLQRTPESHICHERVLQSAGQERTSASAEYILWGVCCQMSRVILGRQAQMTSSRPSSSPRMTGPASFFSVCAGTFCCSSSRSSAAQGRGSSRLEPSAEGGLRPPCRTARGRSLIRA